MKFLPSRAFAIDKLNNFIDNNLSEYAKLRNFDYGPEKRDNVSCLSPYITHGVISELEVIKSSLKKSSYIKIEKFIQEVLWRIYWKGWLELRPKVWMDFLNQLKALKEKYNNDSNYLNAIEGKTNLECFNTWIKELKNNNYLHNHTRMWFASIWIFTLKLPWQLGAELFMKHLYDGDAASNTLGWRWVAGIQTQGKHYLAAEWNINKFTNNRFQNIKLNENELPINDYTHYQIENKIFSNNNPKENESLIIFDNNLGYDECDFANSKFEKIYLVNHNEREIELSENVINFKKELLKDQKQRLENKSINAEIIDISEMTKIKENINVFYPAIGENLDYLNKNYSYRVNFLYRSIDQFSWSFCNKGFFNFKNHIPKIIAKFI
jgi:deoxyribodipyrimidine photo-lyase